MIIKEHIAFAICLIHVSGPTQHVLRMQSLSVKKVASTFSLLILSFFLWGFLLIDCQLFQLLFNFRYSCLLIVFFRAISLYCFFLISTRFVVILNISYRAVLLFLIVVFVSVDFNFAWFRAGFLLFSVFFVLFDSVVWLFLCTADMAIILLFA